MNGDPEIKGARARGRPLHRYDPKFCARVLRLGGKGCCKAEIAADLGVGCRTLDAWAAAYPDFRDAIRRARALEYAWWLEAGRKGMTDKNWNLASWELQMKNRFGRRFAARGSAKQFIPQPKDATNAARTREDMERKLSRIADAHEADDLFEDPDFPAGC